jgi:hypothetical protein
MRLADFIRANLANIMAEWEAFARTCLPAAETMTLRALRDHAAEMLQAIADDMESSQTTAEQIEKSQGVSPRPANLLNQLGETHGTGYVHWQGAASGRGTLGPSDHSQRAGLKISSPP